jgi:hypothetical protein
MDESRLLQVSIYKVVKFLGCDGEGGRWTDGQGWMILKDLTLALTLLLFLNAVTTRGGRCIGPIPGGR